MDALIAVVAGLGGAALGVWLGVVSGTWSRNRPAFWFWGFAALILLGGVGIAAGGLQVEMDWLFVGGISFIAAGLTALKYISRRIPNLGR
ncbi:MAG: hypothetical protein ACYC6C_09815 [Coriobacteriia bacterium]